MNSQELTLLEELPLSTCPESEIREEYLRAKPFFRPVLTCRLMLSSHAP